jgi:Protein of unknown function (DUF1064)
MRMAARPVRLAQARRSKYGVRTDQAGKLARTVDGVTFDSLAEAQEYGVLVLRLKRGEIRNLELQPAYDLFAAGCQTRIGQYRADFAYDELDKDASWGQAVWRAVTEDVKGFVTPLARWKIKHANAQYGMKIREIKR